MTPQELSSIARSTMREDAMHCLNELTAGQKMDRGWTHPLPLDRHDRESHRATIIHYIERIEALQLMEVER